MLNAHQAVRTGALRPTESHALPQDQSDEGRGNRGLPLWMQYVDPPPGTLRQTPHGTPLGHNSRSCQLRIDFLVEDG